MSRPRAKHRGFTLLEMIVAMMMVAMLAVTLFTSLNIAKNAKRAAERQIQPIRAGSIAMDVISRDVEGILKPNIITDTAVAAITTPYTQFQTPDGTTEAYLYAGGFYATANGNSGSMQFCTIGTDGTPDVPLSEGIRQVEYELQQDAGNTQVLVRRIARNVLPTSQTDPEEEKLCRNVLNFSLRFWDGIEWVTDWDSDSLVDELSQPAIPMAVELTLQLKVDGVNQPGHDPNTYTVRRVIPVSAAMPVPSS